MPTLITTWRINIVLKSLPRIENLSNALLVDAYNLSTLVINEFEETFRSLTLDSNRTKVITLHDYRRSTDYRGRAIITKVYTSCPKASS